MRGKLNLAHSKSGDTGITPADAGKTCRFGVFCRARWDHPRGCGENNFSTADMYSAIGSPPRMRGKLLSATVDAGNNGITPADAGKTVCCRLSAGANQDHPRGCGENVIIAGLYSAKDGSPPRMRGKHTLSRVGRLLVRITPADAGKTLADISSPPVIWDHPRGCGENQTQSEFSVLPKGSPPRMRGKLSRLIASITSTGITPADAGKTHTQTECHAKTQDHPRGCGENRKPKTHYTGAKGSPPRMRGKQKKLKNSPK